MKEWESLLERMRGHLCWSMIGISGGSMFTLDFGDKVNKKIVVSNDKLREDQRNFRGEYTLFVRSAGWRLYHDKKCLCHCNDSNANDGPMVMGLRRLEGKKLLHYECGTLPAELALTFAEGYQLVLGDWEGVKPEDPAYALFGDGLCVGVRMDGDVSVQRSKR